jgi:hypothetical protein
MPHANPIACCQDDGGSNAHNAKIDIPGMVIEEFKQTLVEQIVKSNFYKVIARKPLPQWPNVNWGEFINSDRCSNFSTGLDFS